MALAYIFSDFGEVWIDLDIAQVCCATISRLLEMLYSNYERAADVNWQQDQKRIKLYCCLDICICSPSGTNLNSEISTVFNQRALFLFSLLN